MEPPPSTPRSDGSAAPSVAPGALEIGGGDGDPSVEGAIEEHARRQLHPLPPGLVELYGLLAVLFVLVPEWMAGGALLGLRLGSRNEADLPMASSAWQRLPELRLATLNLAQLRLLARQEGISGYARLEREALSQRLLARLRRHRDATKTL